MLLCYSTLSRLINMVSRQNPIHILVRETSVNFIKINYTRVLNPQLKAK